MPPSQPLTARKGHAANATGQEALYLKSLVDRQVRLQIKLKDGERVSGVLEYFDANILRLTREGKPNLFLYKHHVHTLVEEGRKKVSGNLNGKVAE